MKQRQIGKMLKHLRERKGMTQVQLAEKANLTQGYLAKLESDVKRNPSLDILQRIAKALRVEVTELLRKEG